MWAGKSPDACDDFYAISVRLSHTSCAYGDYVLILREITVCQLTFRLVAICFALQRLSLSDVGDCRGSRISSVIAVPFWTGKFFRIPSKSNFPHPKGRCMSP